MDLIKKKKINLNKMIQDIGQNGIFKIKDELNLCLVHKF